jgi:hypothetical protein
METGNKSEDLQEAGVLIYLKKGAQLNNPVYSAKTQYNLSTSKREQRKKKDEKIGCKDRETGSKGREKCNEGAVRC